MVSSGALGASNALERLETLLSEHLRQRAQAIRPLRMAERREVIEAGLVMGDKQRGHRPHLTLQPQRRKRFSPTFSR